jgi:hypothetical protein
MATERVIASYLIETPQPLKEAAEVLAGEQSSGTFVADAMPVIFQPDWKKVFAAEQLLASTRKITEIK